MMLLSERTAQRHTPGAGRGDNWRDQALCVGADPELWWAEAGSADRARAVTICRRCTVRGQCLVWAVSHGEDWGIWGGLDPVERRAVSGRVRSGQTTRCEHCHHLYEARRPGQRYCGHRCHNEAMRRHTGQHGAADCGTTAAARRHRKHGERLDEACRLAESLYRAQLRARTRQEAPA